MIALLEVTRIARRLRHAGRAVIPVKSYGCLEQAGTLLQVMAREPARCILAVHRYVAPVPARVRVVTLDASAMFIFRIIPGPPVRMKRYTSRLAITRNTPSSTVV